MGIIGKLASQIYYSRSDNEDYPRGGKVFLSDWTGFCIILSAFVLREIG